MIPVELKKAALSVGGRSVTVESANLRAFLLWVTILIGVGTLVNGAFAWIVGMFLPILMMPILMAPSGWAMWWVITQRSKGHFKVLKEKNETV